MVFILDLTEDVDPEIIYTGISQNTAVIDLTEDSDMTDSVYPTKMTECKD